MATSLFASLSHHTFLAVARAEPLPQKLSNFIDAVTSYQWSELLWSLFVVVASFAAGRALSALLLRFLDRWSTRTQTRLDDFVARHMTQPMRWLLPLFVLRSTLPLHNLPVSVRGFFAQVLLIMLIVSVGWLVVRSLRVIEDAVEARFCMEQSDNLQARAVHTQMSAFRNVASFVIGVLTVGFALTTFERVRQLGAGLLASAGVAGIVLGFAAQKTIGTVLAGIQIALTQPIRVGDVVIVENEWGTIEEITLTYVVVKIWDKRRLVVPINYFIEKPFQNWTRVSADLLGTVELHLDYAVPVEAIRKEFKRILDASELWDGETWGVQVTAASERSMLVRPLFSARNAGDQWNLRCEVREKLIEFVQQNYPQSLPRLRTELSGASAKALDQTLERA